MYILLSAWTLNLRDPCPDSLSISNHYPNLKRNANPNSDLDPNPNPIANR